MALEKRKLYEIEWMDHFSHEGFFNTDLSDFDCDAYFITTIGYYIGQNSNYIFLAHSLTNTNQCADIMAVLKKVMVGEPRELT